MSRIIGNYEFPSPQALTDAKPPKGKGGVYVFLVKPSDNSSGVVRYIGSSSDLQQRVNWGHEKAKELLNEVKRDPEKVLVTWLEIDSKPKYLLAEMKLISHFKDRVINSEVRPK